MDARESTGVFERHCGVLLALLVNEGVIVGGFCREGVMSDMKELDLTYGSEILKRSELVCV